MNGKRVMKTKQPVALVALLVLLCCTVAGTLAYLVTNTDPVTNTFTPAHVSTAVDETFKNGIKSDVKIQNTGDIPAYIRAAVIINWADANGNVYGKNPVKDTDYTLTLKANNGWIQGSDGYYYYTQPVDPNGFTDFLIESCVEKGSGCPDSAYKLQVTILADGIQSEPADAVTQAWGVTVANDGTISKN